MQCTHLNVADVANDAIIHFGAIGHYICEIDIKKTQPLIEPPAIDHAQQDHETKEREFFSAKPEIIARFPQGVNSKFNKIDNALFFLAYSIFGKWSDYDVYKARFPSWTCILCVQPDSDEDEQIKVNHMLNSQLVPTVPTQINNWRGWGFVNFLERKVFRSSKYDF